MRAYGSGLAASVKKIKKTHKRTKFISALYTFAAFVLTVMVFFPSVNVKFAGRNKLFIGTFFKPILNIFKNDLNILDMLTMVLYLVMVVLVVLNFFKCSTRFGKIMRRNSGNVTTCNKNLLIMEEIGHAFSGAFASYVIFNLAIYMINYSFVPAPKPFGAVTLWAVIALAICVIVHFIAGVSGGNVSVYIVGSNIEEKKREQKIGIFFLRNFVQVLATAGILFFFVPATNVYIEIGKMFGDKTSVFNNIGGDMMAFLAVLLQIAVLPMLFVLIKHATATTEYSLIGMDAIGINNFRVFGIITGLLCVGLFFLDKDLEGASIINYLIAGGIALVAVVADFLIKPRKPKQKEDDPVLRKLKEKSFDPSKDAQQAMPQAQQLPPQAANCCLYARPCYPTGVTPQQQAEEETKQEEKETTAKEEVKETPVKKEGLPEGLPPQELLILDVKCPSCGKTLVIKDGSPYHRCPACGKVFQIRKGKKLSGQAEEATETDSEQAE